MQSQNILKQESGQMVILVMLVLVIALTIGLSLVTRTVTNIRLSNNTELSNRAYSAAEAGIEEALRSQAQGSANVGTNLAASNYTTTITQQGSSSLPFAFPNKVARDEAQQIWLFNYAAYKGSSPTAFPPNSTSGSQYYENYFNDFSGSATSRTLTAYWGSGSPATIPALEASFIYKDSASANFGIDKCALDPNVTRSTNNQFDSTSGSPNCFSTQALQIGTYTITTNQGTKTYKYKKDFTIPKASTPNKYYLLLRLKMLYTDTEQELAVAPTGGNLPSQGQTIDSQGTANDVVRKIRVYQSYPSLPSIFDFVLFNGSNTPLSK